MFASAEKRVRSYMAATTLPIPVVVGPHGALGGAAVTFYLDDQNSVSARLVGPTWHVFISTPYREVEDAKVVLDTKAPSAVRPDVVAVMLLSLLAGVGLTPRGAVGGNVIPIPGYRGDWTQYKERILASVAFIFQMAQGTIPHQRTITTSASEVARTQLSMLMDEYPGLLVT